LSKGERLIKFRGESNQRLRNTEKDQKHLHEGIIPKENLDRGSIPKESSARGRNTKGRYHFPLMSEGER